MMIVLSFFSYTVFMKNLEKDKLETLLDIIGTTPAFQVAHFTDGGDELMESLNSYCTKQEFHYQVNCTNRYFYESIKEKYQAYATTKVMNFPLQRRAYKIQAREYNFIFVSSIIEKEMRSDFLKRAYKIIRSAGSIIIFISKKDYDERDNWVELLEESLYVSTSVIDDLFKNYDIIISRKMHGWGD